MAILDELKKKANGKADDANNIAEAIARMTDCLAILYCLDLAPL